MKSLTTSSVSTLQHSKPTFVFLHGAFGDCSQWQRWQQCAKEHNAYACALDLRGHGANPYDLKWVSTQSCADDTIRFLQSNGGPNYLVGHSWGGLIAQVVATQRPDLVDKLVLLASSPPHGIRLPIQWRFAKYTVPILAKRLVELLPEDEKFLLGRSRATLHPESGLALYEVLRGKCHVAQSTNPTFVVAAENDQLLPLEVQDKIAKLHKAKFEIERGAEHMLHIDPVTAERTMFKVFEWCDNHK